MRIGVAARVLVVAGLAAAVASPSFVDRSQPGFPELFERFRTSNMTITYSHSHPPGALSLPVGADTVQFAKSADSYARIDRTYSVWLYDAGSNPVGSLVPERYQYSVVFTPTSARHCSSEIQAPASTFPQCIRIGSAERDLWEQRAAGMLLLPRVLDIVSTGRDPQIPRWSRQGGRMVLGRPSACFRATLRDEGTFTLCLADRGELLYASVRDGQRETTIEATGVEHSVDMSLFDEKKFLNED